MASAKVFFLGGFLLVVIVVGLVWVRFRDCPGVFRRDYHATLLGDSDFIDEKVRFQMQWQGTLGLPDGRLGDFATVRATDCVEVVEESLDEGSPEGAADEMEKRVRAGRVIEREPIQVGEFSGQRTVLLAQNAKAEMVIQYNTRRVLYVISSVSLAHALAYEKLIQHGYRLDRDGYVIDVTEPYRPATR